MKIFLSNSELDMMPAEASTPQNSKASTQYNKQNTKLKIYFRHQKTYFFPWSTDILSQNYENTLDKSQW